MEESAGETPAEGGRDGRAPRFQLPRSCSAPNQPAMNPGIYRSVLDWIPEGARVLDLGAGDGAFLQQLAQQRHVNGEGVEKNPELVARCIQRGLVAHQGDIADGLDQYGDQTFNYVLLLGTFQELVTPDNVIRDAFRVGRSVIIAYSNFAHYWVRLQVLFGGRTPVTSPCRSPGTGPPICIFYRYLTFANSAGKRGFRKRAAPISTRAGRSAFSPIFLPRKWLLCWKRTTLRNRFQGLRTQRKPLESIVKQISVAPDSSQLRVAEAQLSGLLDQAPPRSTRFSPWLGPWGLSRGLFW